MSTDTTEAVPLLDRLRRLGRDYATTTRRYVAGLPDDRPAEHRLPLHAISGNLTYNGSLVRAWYVLHPVGWSFKTAQQQDNILHPQMVGYAATAGRSIHLRRLPRPIPIAQWGEQYDRQHPAPPNRAAWVAQQRRTLAVLGSAPRNRPITYVGVEVCKKDVLDKTVDAIQRNRSVRDKRRVDAALREVHEAMTGLGRPATADEVAELVHRSVALGMPTPPMLMPGQTWDGPALLEFTDGVTIDPRPGQTSIRIEVDGHRGGRPAERYVTVLGLARPEDLDIPGRDYPWMPYYDRLGFPIEWSHQVEVLTAEKARRTLETKIKVIADQLVQYRQHRDLDTPPEVEIADQKAREVRAEIATGDPVTTTRVTGQILAAVIGRTEDEVDARVEAFMVHGRRQGQQWTRVLAQAAAAQSFIPGAKVAAPSHQRRMKIGYWVTAVPNVEAILGDGTGMFLGVTDGTIREPVFWGRHHAIRFGEQSGMMPLGGSLGSGKSTLLADIAHEGSIGGQEKWTLVDPSGPLANMAGMSDYRGGLAAVLDLMRAEPGTGSPFALIPEPRRSDYPPGDAGDRDFHRAGITARAARKTLALDLLKSVLHADSATGNAELLLRKAIRTTEGRADASCRQVVAALKDLGAAGLDLASLLEDIAEHPGVQLFWEAGDVAASLADYRLLIIKIAGFDQPDMTQPPREWTVEQRMSLVATLVGAHVATKRLYDCPMEELKGYGQDEAHILQRWSSGRALETRIDRDSRKWRIRGVWATHSAEEFVGGGREDRISEVIWGDTQDPKQQAAALRLLRVQPGAGYERTLGSLSPLDPRTNERPPWRRFVMRDASGRVEVIRNDMSHKPELLAVISPKDSATVLRLGKTAA